MKKLILSGLLISLCFVSIGQVNNPLPRGFAPGEEEQMDAYLKSREKQAQNKSYRAPIYSAPTEPVRSAAQWEEIQALVISWTSFPVIQRQIVQAAQQECMVVIHCSDSNAVKSDLTSNSIPLTNLKFIEADFNSIWIRDYGANTCYINDVDSLILVDWIYNRPRPEDDDIPLAYSSALNIPLYQTLSAPNNLMNTGGNWMVDGIETAFASELIIDENDGAGPYSIAYPNHNEAAIDGLVQSFQGINRYIKMEVLPYDDIHHIDMHMKLLDEKTLLIGEFPADVSDGPQIEANIDYVLSTYMNPWGEPYEVVRIPMPPSTSGGYAGGPFGNGYYRTYSNMVIANKTIIVPAYREEYDTTALRIIEENMPGYNVVMIDADNSGSNLIASGGVIHCITHTVGVADPLRIVHNSLPDTYNTTTAYQVDAIIQHKTGINQAKLYWKTDLSTTYTAIDMTLTNASTDTWSAAIPAQAEGTNVHYYILGEAVSGKEQVRPMPAPEGYWSFKVLGENSAGVEENFLNVFSKPIYPNVSHGITCIPFNTSRPLNGKLYVTDVTGKMITTIFEGDFKQGETKFFINTYDWTAGAYSVIVQTNEGTTVQKLMVR